MSTQKEYRIDFSAVKELSLSEFLDMHLSSSGKKVGTSLRYSSCPECGDSNAGSFKLAVSKDDRTWHCFSCGTKGSILDAATRIWGNSLVEAAEQLLGKRNDFKTLAKPKIDRAVEEAETAAKTARMREAFSIIQEVCSSEFYDEPDPLNFLVHTRKIPLAIVREAQKRGMVGFLPADANVARKVLVDAVGENLLRETGLWKPEAALPGISYRPLVFFLPNLSSAEFRHIGETKQGWSKSIRYGVLEYPYFWEGTDKQCMIVEGMIDLMSAVALGFKGHVLGLTGCNTFHEHWFPAAAKRHDLKRYVIALDNDADNPNNPGQTWAKKINEIINGMDIPSFIRTPEHGDINDILRSQSSSK